MSLSKKVFIGLAAGLTAGAAIAATENGYLLTFVSVVEPVGKLWINAILMTIIPLVVSSLIVAVATTTDARVIGRIGWRAIVLFLALLAVTAIIAALVMPTVFSWLPLDPATSESLRARAAETVSGSATAPPSAGQWVVSLVPTNPIKAASDGAMLPLIVFTLAFALAVTRISSELRSSLVRFFQAVAEAVTVLLGWILLLSPVGVFSLTLVHAARAGSATFATLGYYIVVTSVTTVVFTLPLYVVATIGGRVSLRRFARACAPAQIVALSSHSSLASLPAMIEGAQTRLGLPPASTGFVLPLAVSIFRFSAPSILLTAVFFISRVYVIPISPSRIVPTVMMAVLSSFATAGVPSAALFVAGPVLLAAGLPTEAMGLLFAVDTIPSPFRTVANVTASLTAATVLSRQASGLPIRVDPVRRPHREAVTSPKGQTHDSPVFTSVL